MNPNLHFTNDVTFLNKLGFF